MPWDMHRLKLREWRMIVHAGNEASTHNTAGELPPGWENLPVES